MRRVRRVLLLVGLTTLAVAAIAATASAQRVTKLRVITYRQHGHRVSHNSFLIRGLLKDAANRSNRVGRFEAKFTRRPHHRTAVRAVAIFDRTGSLKVKGVQGPRDNRIPIIGGTGAFNGAAGKLITRDLRGNHTLLTFLFVQ
jgi:hypothetical protein